MPTDGPERANRRVTVRRITPLLQQGQADAGAPPLRNNVTAHSISKIGRQCPPFFYPLANESRGDFEIKAPLLPPLPQRAQAQGIEADEALGIAVIVGDRAFLEGDEVLIVERILATPGRSP